MLPISAAELEIDLRRLWDDNPWVNLALALGAIVLGWLAGRISQFLLRRSAERSERRGWTLARHLAADLIGPAKLALLTLGLLAAMELLQDARPLGAFSRQCVSLLFATAGIWYAFNLCGLVDVLSERISARRQSTIERQLAPFLRKLLRASLLIVGVLFVANAVFERDIGAWLAGLGIAGIAISLAAQDSLKNLLGSVTLLLDRPFQLGDRIQVGTFEGIVEEVGFRSTKLRTNAGTVITIPNSKIVNDPVENLTRRVAIRREVNLTLPNKLPIAKVREAIQVISDALKESEVAESVRPTIDREPTEPRVGVSAFTADNVTVQIAYWFTPPDLAQFQSHCHRFNLRLLERFAEAGLPFALPDEPRPPLPGKPKSSSEPDEAAT